MFKKTAVFFILAFLLFSILSGCRTNAGETITTEKELTILQTETAEDKSPPATDKTQAPQEIIAGLGRDPGVQYGYGAHPPLTRVLEPLLFNDVELSYLPGLAKSWEISPDGLTWTLMLVEGVKFHDGTDFNADAVKHNLLRVIKTSPDLFGKIESINILDNYTIEINHSKPFGSFLYSLSWPGAAMISPEAIDEEGRVIEPIGTGPYKRVEWISGERMVLEKNDDYWAGQPILEKITLVNIPDATTRLLALEAGEIDMIIDTGGIMPEHVAMIKTFKDINVLSTDGAVPHYMSINTIKAPFDDVNVRKAIMHALNPEGIIQYALEGYGKIMTSVTPNSEPFWLHPDNLYEFNNQQKAIDMLEQSGWTDADGNGILDKDGKDFIITFLLSTSLIGRWPYLTIAEIVQAELKKIGIIVEIKILDGGLWSKTLREGGADLSIRPWAGISPQTRLFSWLHSRGDQNIAMGINLSNPEIDRLIDLALAETDENKARELLLEVQEIAADQVSIIPVYDEVLINATKKNVKGYKLHPWFYVNWEEIYIEND